MKWHHHLIHTRERDKINVMHLRKSSSSEKQLIDQHFTALFHYWRLNCDDTKAFLSGEMPALHRLLRDARAPPASMLYYSLRWREHSRRKASKSDVTAARWFINLIWHSYTHSPRSDIFALRVGIDIGEASWCVFRWTTIKASNLARHAVSGRHYRWLSLTIDIFSFSTMRMEISSPFAATPCQLSGPNFTDAFAIEWCMASCHLMMMATAFT